MPKVLKLVGALLLACAVSASASAVATVLGGLVYKFPTADGTTGQVLVNNGSGTLSWVTASPGGSATMPTGLVVFSTETCASLGYSDYSAGTGFYPVGATTGLGGTVGTALTNRQDRATGNHTHSVNGTVNISNGSHNHGVTDNGHTHSWNPSGQSFGREPDYILVDSGPPEVWEWEPGGYYGVSGSGRTSGDSGVGATIGNTAISASGSISSFTVNDGGTGTGTNAPYRQLRMCQK